ncbi:hypothetical protein [Vreelandella sp. EE22]
MAITRNDAVLGLCALMFGKAVGVESFTRFEAILDANPSFNDLAGSLAATQAFGAQFAPGSPRQEKIDVILARLGLAEDSPGYARGSDFINQRLDAGASAGQVLVEIGETLLSDSLPRGLEGAANVLSEAIMTARAHLEAGNEGNLVLLMGGPATPAFLAQALTTLQDAQQARAAFLEEVASTDALAPLIGNNSPLIAGNKAITTLYLDTASEIVRVTEGFVGNQFASRSAAVQDILIDDARLQGDKALVSAQVGVKPSVVAALDTLDTAREAIIALGNAYQPVQLNHDGEVAYFEAINKGVTVKQLLNTLFLNDAQTPANNRVITLSADGSYTLEGPSIRELKGFEALLTASVELFKVSLGIGDAELAFLSALTNVISLQVGIPADQLPGFQNYVDIELSVGADDRRDITIEFRQNSDVGPLHVLQQVRTALDALESAVDAFEEARALRDTLATLNGEVESAENAVSALGYTLKDFATGESAGQDDDLYLFVESTGEARAVTIQGFGEQGSDSLYFGEGFQAVKLGEGQVITDRVGAFDQLEIFWRQDGDDLTLYVEAHPTGGNATTPADITQVTLSGVNVQDVDYANGFLTVSAA